MSAELASIGVYLDVVFPSLYEDTLRRDTPAQQWICERFGVIRLEEYAYTWGICWDRARDLTILKCRPREMHRWMLRVMRRIVEADPYVYIHFEPEAWPTLGANLQRVFWNAHHVFSRGDRVWIFDPTDDWCMEYSVDGHWAAFGRAPADAG